MKRNKFLLNVATASYIPFQSFSKTLKTLPKPAKRFKIAAGEGRIYGPIKLKGINANILDLKISGKDTNWGMAIFEQTSLSQGKGTPLHIHHFQNEIFYVLEGEYFFKVGEDEFHLSKGDSIFLPEKIPHAWTQIAEKGKMIVTFQPAGKMEEFFTTEAALDHEPTKQEMAKIFEEHEMEIVGPALTVNQKI